MSSELEEGEIRSLSPTRAHVLPRKPVALNTRASYLHLPLGQWPLPPWPPRQGFAGIASQSQASDPASSSSYEDQPLWPYTSPPSSPPNRSARLAVDNVNGRGLRSSVTGQQDHQELPQPHSLPLHIDARRDEPDGNRMVHLEPVTRSPEPPLQIMSTHLRGDTRLASCQVDSAPVPPADTDVDLRSEAKVLILQIQALGVSADQLSKYGIDSGLIEDVLSRASLPALSPGRSAAGGVREAPARPRPTKKPDSDKEPKTAGLKRQRAPTSGSTATLEDPRRLSAQNTLEQSADHRRDKEDQRQHRRRSPCQVPVRTHRNDNLRSHAHQESTVTRVHSSQRYPANRERRSEYVYERGHGHRSTTPALDSREDRNRARDEHRLEKATRRGRTTTPAIDSREDQHRARDAHRLEKATRRGRTTPPVDQLDARASTKQIRPSASAHSVLSRTDGPRDAAVKTSGATVAVDENRLRSLREAALASRRRDSANATSCAATAKDQGSTAEPLSIHKVHAGSSPLPYVQFLQIPWRREEGPPNDVVQPVFPMHPSVGLSLPPALWTGGRPPPISTLQANQQGQRPRFFSPAYGYPLISSAPVTPLSHTLQPIPLQQSPMASDCYTRRRSTGPFFSGSRSPISPHPNYQLNGCHQSDRSFCGHNIGYNRSAFIPTHPAMMSAAVPNMIARNALAPPGGIRSAPAHQQEHAIDLQHSPTCRDSTQSESTVNEAKSFLAGPGSRLESRSGPSTDTLWPQPCVIVDVDEDSGSETSVPDGSEQHTHRSNRSRVSRMHMRRRSSSLTAPVRASQWLSGPCAQAARAMASRHLQVETAEQMQDMKVRVQGDEFAQKSVDAISPRSQGPFIIPVNQEELCSIPSAPSSDVVVESAHPSVRLSPVRAGCGDCATGCAIRSAPAYSGHTSALVCDAAAGGYVEPAYAAVRPAACDTRVQVDVGGGLEQKIALLKVEIRRKEAVQSAKRARIA
ncbi:unnamed protein product [Parajaminaea phylloscopi]